MDEQDEQDEQDVQQLRSTIDREHELVDLRGRPDADALVGDLHRDHRAIAEPLDAHSTS